MLVPRDFALGLCIVVLGLGGGACGPSLRMMHESSMYFERCHSAELLDGVSGSDRAECWRRWLEWYSVGQEPARVLHARERMVYLSQGEALDPLPTPGVSVQEEAPPETPPQTGGGTVPRPHVYLPGLPSPRTDREDAACRIVCQPRWDACVAPCGEDSGRRACVGACQADFGNCMRACY